MTVSYVKNFGQKFSFDYQTLYRPSGYDVGHSMIMPEYSRKLTPTTSSHSIVRNETLIPIFRPPLFRVTKRPHDRWLIKNQVFLRKINRTAQYFFLAISEHLITYQSQNNAEIFLLLATMKIKNVFKTLVEYTRLIQTSMKKNSNIKTCHVPKKKTYELMPQKKRSLGKDSFLGLVKDMRCLNTSQLLGGANGYAFINCLLLHTISNMLHLHIQSLDSPIPIKGFNYVAGKPVTEFVTLNLTIDSRVQSCTPFLITNLGNCDLILGRQWLAFHYVLPDCFQHKLIWPENYPPTYICTRLTVIPLKRDSSNDTDHQCDANRRNALLDHEDLIRSNRPKELHNNIVERYSPKQERATPSFSLTISDENFKSKTIPEIAQNPARLPNSSVSSFLKDQTDAFRKMEKELKNDLDVGEPPFQKTLTPKQKSLFMSSKKTPKINIAAISGPALHFNGKRSENEIFTTSIHELDVLIASKQQDQLSSINEIKKSATLASITASDDEIQIPQQYSEYSHVFSKADSNTLPPHRAYDHKIILEVQGKKALKYSPLYKMSLEELESVKNWITENPNKRFIEPSQ
ncbi:hypothetical protein GcC1_201006 [Golovinomyces cichoracearum]|uniref:Uncharacterized protein n=1 Tax=Golovinomyces cichoracearum TaxID=62708 RepID=A0A420HEA6_9PEZI|nr:hypothetical protein GcC1_201006 [Golovinomyces cichoracearum]